MLKSLSKVLTYEALRVVNLKRRSDEKGKIRFDKEKYFSDCYSFKVKLLRQTIKKDYPFEIGKTWGRYCVRLYMIKNALKL